MGGGEHLNVQTAGGAEDQAPDVRLDGVVKAVFDLVDQQKAIPGIDEGEGDAEQSDHAIAHGAEREWLTRPLDLDDRHGALRCPRVDSDTNTFDVGRNDL